MLRTSKWPLALECKVPSQRDCGDPQGRCADDGQRRHPRLFPGQWEAPLEGSRYRSRSTRDRRSGLASSGDLKSLQREKHRPTLARPKLFGDDFRTGELRRNFEVANAMSPGHHLRCYRSKATDRFILYPTRGAEFLDLDGDNHMRHDWLRGSCRFGVVPCNGLLYTPPDQCFCYGAKMEGLVADERCEDYLDARPPLARTTVEGTCLRDRNRCARATKADWPAYRADAERSGSNPQATVSQHPSMKWDVTLGGKLTQPVIAAGKVFVAAVDGDMQARLRRRVR